MNGFLQTLSGVIFPLSETFNASFNPISNQAVSNCRTQTYTIIHRGQHFKSPAHHRYSDSCEERFKRAKRIWRSQGGSKTQYSHPPAILFKWQTRSQVLFLFRVHSTISIYFLPIISSFFPILLVGCPFLKKSILPLFIQNFKIERLYSCSFFTCQS